MSRSIVAAGWILLVLTGGLVLVFVVTLRPWASANESYDTHLNLSGDAPGSYSRTSVTWVDGLHGAPKPWVPRDNIQVDGYILYTARGCAACHGLSAKGSFVGPTLLGASERKIAKIVRDGTGGMPTYHYVELSDQEMTAISEYIQGLGPAPTETPALARPTATPYPRATPTPAPTATPTATPLPGVTPVAATPTPSPTPTVARPALSPAELKAAQQLFADVGCDICHGAKAEGGSKGPKLSGLTREGMVKAIREGVVRQPDSKYPRAMEAVKVSDLSDQELEQIIKFLLSLS
ncbi:MAG: c-type cytochrome [Chloroflexi bacterium]|nr:c-type cytochrome [Chloroflexota bacterium]